MAKGFFISKTLGLVGIVLGLGALATIIALSVVYSQEKQKNASVPNAAATTSPATATTTTSIPTTAATTTSIPTTAAATSIPGTVPGTIPDPTTAGPNNPWNQLRLPKTLAPNNYTVVLQPFLTPDDQGLYLFHGNSTVQFVCLEPTDVILIHSKKLNYTSQEGFLVSLSGVDGATAPPITETWLQEDTEYLVVQLRDPLERNKSYELHSIFVGELADDLAGFYRSEYQEDGMTKVVATTQMQAADARKAFPCFDEPAMKASFSVVLIHLSDHVALSNMPVHTTEQMTLEDGKSWNRTTFQPTLKMSTYLLAFIVSQFESVDANQNGTLWLQSQPDCSLFLLHADQVALPDFNAGAMENWGLVTYRENSLLFDPNFSSIGNKERVVTVIAHELAHQVHWQRAGGIQFGESIGFCGINLQKDLMVSNDMYRVMAIDALASSHPLSFREEEINTPAEISEIFDAIAYSKGASVLRMLSEFLTEERFKRGLQLTGPGLVQAHELAHEPTKGDESPGLSRAALFPCRSSAQLTQESCFTLALLSPQSYLHAYEYGNTVYDNLWEHLQKVVDEDKFALPGTIKTIMDRWVLQMGFPVLTVNTSTGALTQQHFLLSDTPVQRPSEFNYTWIVPVSWLTSDGTSGMYWLTESTASVADFAIAADPGKWLLTNLNVTGYFRKYVQKQIIPLFNYFKNVTSDWTNIPDGLMDHEKGFLSRLPPVPVFLPLRYSEILAISTACSYGVPECQALATDLFSAWRANPAVNP
ncbi:hypothetical protein JD844_014785 [Phrynosoma platyrhinos]|uniref:Aminopeptidase n=1 Tax=Phrynosoma platyrhinos TaxID=52577 RepID=A0ABQ7SS13_PHRPL|nr:hypothetical protein JD844_014785 [Phrynosoma platyrhinos]